MLIDIKGTYSKINTLTANKYLGFYDANKVFPVIWRVGKTVNTLPFQGKDCGFESHWCDQTNETQGDHNMVEMNIQTRNELVKHYE